MPEFELQGLSCPPGAGVRKQTEQVRDDSFR